LATSEDYAAFIDEINKLHDLGKALAVLSWDREVNMPPRGDDARIAQMTTLRQLIHQRSVSDAMGELIAKAETALETGEPDDQAAALVAVVKRDFDRARALPERFVVEASQVGAKAWRIWKQARESSDFESFAPYLERLIALQREKAGLLGHEGEPYDALLEDFEPGMTATRLRTLFEEVVAATRPLLSAILDRGNRVDVSPLHQGFPIAGISVVQRIPSPRAFREMTPASRPAGTLTF
jgi:carboxypeptidase Taq